MTFSVFCQPRSVSDGITRQNKENLFLDFLNISPIFFMISISRNDQMGPFPMEYHTYTSTFSSTTVFIEVSLLLHRSVSDGITCQNKKNLFFRFLNISPIFFIISISRNDQMGPFPMECHTYTSTFSSTTVFIEVSLLPHVPVHTLVFFSNSGFHQNLHKQSCKLQLF